MSKKKPTKRLLWIAGGLVLLLLILGTVGRATGLLGGGEKPLEVETAAAQVRAITQLVTASGKVQPETEVKISPDVSGEIIALPVGEGQEVRQGALLARIKPDYYAAQVEQAQAGVLQAQATLAQREADRIKADQELKRQQDLFERQVIAASLYEGAKASYDMAVAAYSGAEYAVQSAQARLREASEQLGKTAVYAPIDGTISMLNVELGERVVGANMMSGTEMMRIARLDAMEIEVDVNENDVVNVVVGDSAAIDIDAYPGRSFRGLVTEIANSARVTGAGTQEQATNFPVKIRILHREGAADGGLAPAEIPTSSVLPTLRPGMSGTVDIFTETIPSTVVVPIQAVTVRDFNRLGEEDAETSGASGGLLDEEDLRRVVFIVEEDRVRMVEVETGIADDTHIEIRSGLVGGETIVTGPYRAVSRELEPEAPVQVKDAKGRPSTPALAGR